MPIIRQLNAEGHPAPWMANGYQPSGLTVSKDWIRYRIVSGIDPKDVA